MIANTVTAASARLLAFEAQVDDVRRETFPGCCSDCGVDGVALTMDPSPELAPDAYCAACIVRRIADLRAFLTRGRR